MITLSAKPAIQAPISEENKIVRSGKHWRIRFQNIESTVRNRKGLGYLLPLLQNPSVSLNVLQISHISSLPDTFFPKVIQHGDQNPLIAENPTSVASAHCVESVSDQLKLLWDKIEIAQAQGDQAARLEYEEQQQTLLKAIASSQDQNSEFFELNKQQHNTRSRICQQIRNFVKDDVAAALPELAKHLNDSLSYGLECCYKPMQQMHWQVLKTA